MPKLGKPKSKRTPVRLRNKIQKASAAKTRKDKKLAKKDPTWRSRLKKDPGIPNLFPYKDRLIHEAEEGKRRKEQEVLERRETARAQRNGTAVKGDEEDEAMAGANDEQELLDYAESASGDDQDEDDGMVDVQDEAANPMAALLASARARATEFDNEGIPEDDGDDSDGSDGAEFGEEGVTNKRQNRDASRHAYDKAFKEVISASDVVLYVLDARDPMGTRSRATEQDITSSPDRRVILVLNKIDLVPPPVLQGWLKHLGRSYPTLPLRASTGSAPNSKTFDHKNLTTAKTSDALLKALKNWAGSRQLKRAVNVGIIGYPNVGKSSVINALTSRLGARKQACPVGAEAGVTTAVRTVKLDGRIKLLDSPGIVFAGGEADSSSGGSAAAKAKRKAKRQEEQARLVLLNAVPPREVVDPVPAVALLLSRLSATPALYAALLETYGIPGGALRNETADPTHEFLINVARARGRLGKGGVPNLHAAAQTVVGDWREGRIQGWVEAPHEPDAVKAGVHAADVLGQSETRRIVGEWAAEFKLDGLWGDDADADNVSAAPASADVTME